MTDCPRLYIGRELRVLVPDGLVPGGDHRLAIPYVDHGVITAQVTFSV